MTLACPTSCASEIEALGRRMIHSTSRRSRGRDPPADDGFPRCRVWRGLQWSQRWRRKALPGRTSGRRQRSLRRGPASARHVSIRRPRLGIWRPDTLIPKPKLTAEQDVEMAKNAKVHRWRLASISSRIIWDGIAMGSLGETYAFFVTSRNARRWRSVGRIISHAPPSPRSNINARGRVCPLGR